MGGTSHCTGRLEMNYQGEWRPVDGTDWNQKSSSVVCRQLDCGSAVSTERTSDFAHEPVWLIHAFCVGTETSVRECGTKRSLMSTKRLEVICSGNKPSLTTILYKTLLLIQSFNPSSIHCGRFKGYFCINGEYYEVCIIQFPVE